MRFILLGLPFFAGCIEDKDTNAQADVLFVVDNSASMKEEAISLGEHFASLMNSTGVKLDYQVALTTSSVDSDAGPSGEVDAGEAGKLLGDSAIVQNGEENMNDILQKNLYCGGTYWDENEIPSDPNYSCGDEPSEVSAEYLDCICGSSNWAGISGAGNEEPLEAALLTLCRSVENPPDSCLDPSTPFNESDVLSNPDFIREGSTVVIVTVGDEGDASRRMNQGESSPDVYLNALNEFDFDIRFAAIGPNLTRDTGAFVCNTAGANNWMVERLAVMADEKQGFYGALESKNSQDNCELNDFTSHMEKLGTLLKNL